MHRGFKVVLLFVLTSCGLLTWSRVSFAENPQVTVSVYDDARVPADTLTRAEQQATQTFSRVGLDITWLNCSDINGDCGFAAWNEGDGPIHLVLRITPNMTKATTDTAFGVAYLGSDGIGRNGNVFWKKLQELQTNSKVDGALLLASVMAHEMGHLLLGSNAHAISGIMRAHWEDSELHRIRMGTLQFLPEQGKQMRARLNQQKTVLMSSGARSHD